MKPEKKSERLEIRLGHSEKQDFIIACDSQGDTPSGALRRFIRGYVRRARGDLRDEAFRRFIRGRITRPVLLWMGAATAAMLAVLIAVPGRGGDTDDAIFAALDRDRDGELMPAEQGLSPSPQGESNGVMRVLDLDGSGTLSRSEFMAQGRMVYAKASGNGILPFSDGESPPMTLVEFSFDAQGVTSGTFENARINAGNLDRLVIWYPDGTSTFFEGDINITSGSELTILSDTATFPASVNIRQDEDGHTIVSHD